MAMQVLSGPATIQGSPEWLAWRMTGIGASDAPIIMGKSLYTRAYELYKQKTGRAGNAKPNPILDKIRERGHQLEPLARAAVQQETGHPLTPMIGVSAVHPFIRSSYDGYDAFNGEPTEIKCPGPRAHSMALAGYVPEEYVDQLQHQLFVAEAEWGNYYSFDGTKGKLIRVPRDQKRIDEIVSAEIAFWRRVQSGVWETDEWAAAATHYLLVKRELDDLKEREQFARQMLIDLMPAGDGQREGNGLLVTRSKKKGDVEYSRLLADRQITLADGELDRYRKTGSDVVRVTVTRDIDLQSIDQTPLQMPKPGQLIDLPTFEEYSVGFDIDL